jgi:hypothetical protein
MKNLNLIFVTISVISTIYLVSLFVRAIIIPAFNEYKFKKQHKKNEENGLTPFLFENGTVTIYAKTQQGAIFQYKELKKKFKKASKN